MSVIRRLDSNIYIKYTIHPLFSAHHKMVNPLVFAKVGAEKSLH